MNKKNQERKINNTYNNISSLTILSLLFSVAIAFSSAFDAMASEEKINTPVLFQPPPGEEQPEETEGAGTRDGGSCSHNVATQALKTIDDRSDLTAIAPYRNSNYGAKIIYGGTTKGHPTFWVNLPKTSAQKAILMVKKGSDAPWHQLLPHWQQTISLPEKAGIIDIELSKDAPALEIGKNYQWKVVLVCGNSPNPNDPEVTAGIKRIDPSQINNSNVPTTQTELDKASLYARQGIWYDALDIVVEEKSSWNNWNDIWVGYLQSGGLARKIANEPVIDKSSGR